MSSEEQNQFASRADVDLMKNQLDQLVDAMLALARRENNPRRPIVTENIIPQPVRIPVEDQVIQERHIIQDEHTSSHDAVEYHSFAFTTPNSQVASLVGNVERPQDVEFAEKCRVLEEKVGAMMERDTADLNALNMCLVPGLVIPPKFKMPNFEKYKGDSCLKQHLVMFCRKMTFYARNDKLMIHCFQDSLSGASLSWYMQLESSHIQSWSDLANAFLKQYQYNLDVAPNRIQLQSLSQEENESFRGYAQRWREVAARVQPPLLDRELVDMFIESLQEPYLEKMIANGTSNFSDLVSVRERIESYLKSGKVHDTSNIPASEGESVVSSREEEKDEINTIWDTPHAPSSVPYPPYPSISTVQSQQSYGSTCVTPISSHGQYPPDNRRPQQRRYYNQRPKRHFDPLPIPYNHVLPRLISSGLIVPKGLDPVIPPYPPGFDTNARCGYHAGAMGHSTEDCKQFKNKVQDLIESKLISFTPQGLHINIKPSSGQVSSSVHDMEEAAESRYEEGYHTGLDEQEG